MKPVDLSIGKPLKDNLRINFIKWFDNNHKDYKQKRARLGLNLMILLNGLIKQ